MLGRDSFTGREIENRRALGTQWRALKTGGQVSVAPVRRAPLRIAHLRQDDEAGQILIHRAEAVVHPRTDARIASETVAAIHLIHRGGMIHTVDGATAEEADLIGHPREMRPVLRHVRAALTGLDELEGATHIVPLATFHRRLLLPFADELLEMQPLQRRFWIERVNVRGFARVRLGSRDCGFSDGGFEFEFDY